MNRLRILSIVFIVNGIAPALASGFALEQQNARAIGAAYAGAQARYDDAGFAYYNPAAIADSGSIQFSFNAAELVPFTSYDNASATLMGAFPVAGRANDNGALANAFVPNASLSFPLSDRISGGLVINSPFGLNSRYAADSVIRYHVLKADAKTMSITPLAAFEAYPGVVIGAGVRFQFLDFNASSAIDAAGIALANGIPGFIPGASDAYILLDGSDLGVGYAVGAQVQLTETLRVGASYASKIEHDLNGLADFNIANSTAAQTINALTGMFDQTTFKSLFVTPASASVGMIYDVNESLALMASAVFTRWSSFENVNTTFANPAQPPDIFTQDWKDVWAFSVGAEYSLAPAAQVRAGFMYDQSPASDVFASPRIPDADRYWINAGVSYAVNDQLTIDGGFGYVFLDKRRINLSAAQPENLFRGDLTATFDTTGPVLSLRMHYRLR